MFTAGRLISESANSIHLTIPMTKKTPPRSTPKDVMALAKKAGAKMVDIKFVDTFGTWQHFTCPIAELTEEVFAEGLGLRRLVHPGLEVDRGLATCWPCPTRPRRSSIRSAPCPRSP